MTKYVLNSGGMSKNPDRARRFFAELTDGLGQSPKILICSFAQPREIWESKMDEYTAKFNGFMPDGVTPEYQLALPDRFAQQVAWADAAYFHGGDDHLAMYWFETLDIPAALQGKVIGTNSATTHILSSSFWTCDWRQPMSGMGVLPVRTICHYQSDYGTNDPRGAIDWDRAYSELEPFGDTSQPIHALPEGEFIVINQ